MTGRDVTVQLALDDASGDSAIIEYLDGQPRIHHGRETQVLTNSPPYEQQLERLKRFEGFGGDEALPGTTDAADRFVGAAYYVQRLPEPDSPRQVVAELLSVMRNAAEPFGTVDPARPNISATIWRTVAAPTWGLYFFFESSCRSAVLPEHGRVRGHLPVGGRFRRGDPAVRRLDARASSVNACYEVDAEQAFAERPLGLPASTAIGA